MQNKTLRRSAALFFATANVLLTHKTIAASQPALYDYSILNHVTVNSINTALPLNSPPINGFVPQVVFGLTNQQDRNDFTYSAHIASSGRNKFKACPPLSGHSAQ